MGFKETTHHLKKLLEEMLHDLAKAAGGNKTAAQRVRTASVKFAKVAKVYRKESILAEKGVKKGPLKKSVAKKVLVKKTLKKSR